MTDVRQQLTDYEYSHADPDGECAHDCDDHRGRQAPKAFAALRAILDLHPIGNPGVAAVAWCGGCGDADTAPDWPCPNVQAIVTALEAQ